MDKESLALLEDLFEQAAADFAAHGFARVNTQLANPTRERIQHAGEFLLERAAERFPNLDPYVSSSSDGTINLVLGRHKTQ